MITGQAVETFDFQFRDLYLISRGVSLSKVPMADEPIPDPVPQLPPVPVSATVARKLINPKYALVATGTQESVTSSDINSSNKNAKDPSGLKLTKTLRRVIEEPPVHPALVNMEKAYLIPYLPTWPEPDPPSDVIGFINIRDDKRAHQVHLQRSERFEVSQAIRFSSPLVMPEKTKEAAPPQSTNQAEPADKPADNAKSGSTSSPTSPTKKQPPHSSQNVDQPDSGVSPPGTDPQGKQEVETRPAPPSSSSTVVQQQMEPPPQTQVAQAAPTPPPIPKPRTLHLVIDRTPSEQGDQTQVTVMKMDLVESDKDKLQQLTPTSARMRLLHDAQDSGSNDEGSQDSTKVICDRAAVEEPSSTSTASEEEAFYDCPQPESRDPLTNGVSTGSGCGRRHEGRGNVMARLSQSMLDLREPAQKEDSAALIRQSQQLRRQGNPSPHRHIGQVRENTFLPPGSPSVIRHLLRFIFYRRVIDGWMGRSSSKPRLENISKITT